MKSKHPYCSLLIICCFIVIPISRTTHAGIEALQRKIESRKKEAETRLNEAEARLKQVEIEQQCIDEIHTKLDNTVPFLKEYLSKGTMSITPEELKNRTSEDIKFVQEKLNCIQTPSTRERVIKLIKLMSATIGQ